jgi:hypothetical protein
MEFRPVGAEFHADGRTNGQTDGRTDGTDMKKLISRSWFRASSMIILNKNQPDAH